MAGDLLRIRKWSETFENSKTRKLCGLQWLNCPAGVDSAGYLSLMAHGADGVLALGVFQAICQWSATCRPLIRGLLARSDRRPLSVRQLSLTLRMPEDIVDRSLTLLLSDDVGWLEVCDDENANSDDENPNVFEEPATDPPVVRHSSATDPPVVPVQGRERKGKEGKGVYIYPASEVLIPEKMQTEKVQEYFRTWIAHLTLQYPDKVPADNSPQLEMFWAEAARLGPDRFCEAVQYSTANNWASLHERNETAKHSRSSSGKQNSHSQANEDWIAVLQAIERYPSRSKEDIQGRKTLLGPERFAAMKEIGSGRISESNDFERNQTLKPMFLKHLEELRHATATGN